MVSPISWPDSLISDLARRRAVIFLGAGISRSATNSHGQRPDDWEGFLRRAVRELDCSEYKKGKMRKIIKGGDYLTACEVIKEAWDTGFSDFVRRSLVEPQFEPSTLHDLIIDLDASIVATPNVDNIFESRINSVQRGTVRVKQYYADDVAEAIRSTSRVVLKLHGDVDTPARMIFTRSEYAEVRNVYRSFYEILNALAITHTFLFLGCGLSDPDIRIVLEDYGFLQKFSAPHFFVLPHTSFELYAKNALERSLNIKILAYDSSNNHALLTESITELVGIVNERRQALSENLNW